MTANNYVYAAYLWSLENTGKFPDYEYVEDTKKIKRLKKCITCKPMNEIIETFAERRPQYVYIMRLPAYGKQFLGYGDTRIEARQEVAKLAYDHLKMDFRYLRVPIEGNVRAQAAYEEVRRVLPQSVIFRVEESSGVYYFTVTEKEKGETSYVFDKVLMDVRERNNERAIGKPQIIYLPDMNGQIMNQYEAAPNRLREIRRALEGNLAYINNIAGSRMIPKKRFAYFERYHDEMSRLTKRLKDIDTRQTLWRCGFDLEGDSHDPDQDSGK